MHIYCKFALHIVHWYTESLEVGIFVLITLDEVKIDIVRYPDDYFIEIILR